MTKTSNELQMAREAASAAALIKATAESTATSINISNIKGDISEIKQSIKELGGVFATKVEYAEVVKVQVDHEARTRALEQSMWKYIGIYSVITVIVTIVLPIVLRLFIT